MPDWQNDLRDLFEVDRKKGQQIKEAEETRRQEEIDAREKLIKGIAAPAIKEVGSEFEKHDQEIKIDSGEYCASIEVFPKVKDTDPIDLRRDKSYEYSICIDFPAKGPVTASSRYSFIHRKEDHITLSGFIRKRGYKEISKADIINDVMHGFRDKVELGK